MKLLSTLLLLVLALPVLAQSTTREIRQSLYFASASAKLDATARAELVAFTDNLLAYADYGLSVEAYTDEQGTDAYNESLARLRAVTVEAALSDLLVRTTATEVLTYGESKARQQTTDDNERRQDRRVDLVATVTLWDNAAQAIATARAEQQQRIVLSDPGQRQSIQGKNGGVFLVEANSLVRPDGKPAIGPVSVELIETYDMTEMVLAGLTTSSGDRQLETGGMLKLTATDADGTELQLREGASLTAATPTDGFNERMRIFAGQDHNADGTPAGWDQQPQGVANSAEGLFPALSGRFDRNEWRDVIDGLVYRTMREWDQANPEPKAPTYLRPSPYSRKAPAPIDTSAIFFQPMGMDKLFMSKKERRERTSKKRRLAVKIYEGQLKRHVNAKQYAATMPDKNAAMKATYETAVTDRATRRIAKLKEAREKFTEQFRDRWEQRQQEIATARAERRAAFEAALLEHAETEGVTQRVASRYFFTVAKLGWANIDVFHDSGERVEVLASLPGSGKDATVLLIPEDRPSLLAYVPGQAGETWRRSGVPEGVGYQIIAYQVRDGQLQFAHGRVAAAGERSEELTFQPLALGALKGRIAEIVGG